MCCVVFRGVKLNTTAKRGNVRLWSRIAIGARSAAIVGSVCEQWNSVKLNAADADRTALVNIVSGNLVPGNVGVIPLVNKFPRHLIDHVLLVLLELLEELCIHLLHLEFVGGEHGRSRCRATPLVLCVPVEYPLLEAVGCVHGCEICHGFDIMGMVNTRFKYSTNMSFVEYL